MAAEDADAADMLIIALHPDGEWPEEVKNWITLWLERLEQRGEQRKAVVVVSDPGVDPREGFAADSLPFFGVVAVQAIRGSKS